MFVGVSRGPMSLIPPVTRMTFPERSGISVSQLKLGPLPNISKPPDEEYVL